MGLFRRIGLNIAAGAAPKSPVAGADASGLALPSSGAACRPLLLTYATQMGAAETFAHDTRAQLKRAGVTVRLVPFDALSLDLLAASPQALLIASTTYDGDAPDMAEAFSAQYMQQPAALAPLRYGLLALGDSGYADFCGFGHRLHAWLKSSGAQALFPPVEVDDENAEALARWYRQVARFAAR